MNDNYYTKSCIEKIKNLLKGRKKEKGKRRRENNELCNQIEFNC